MLAGIGDFALTQLVPWLAYIGPGADLALLSSAIGLAATMGASLTFMAMWPVRWLWRRLRTFGKETSPESAPSQ